MLWRTIQAEGLRIFRRLRDRITEVGNWHRRPRLRRRATGPAAVFGPQYHLRAAQAARALDRHPEALRQYGEAIDGYLQAGRGRAAEVMCRKVLEDYPEVVRARRTLALLALGRNDVDEAILLLRDYVSHSRQSGDDQVLIKSLRMFALLAESEQFRSEAIAQLERLGDREGVALIRAGTAAPAAFRGMGPWSRALEAALLGPDTLRSLFDPSSEQAD